MGHGISLPNLPAKGEEISLGYIYQNKNVARGNAVHNEFDNVWRELEIAEGTKDKGPFVPFEGFFQIYLEHKAALRIVSFINMDIIS